MQNEKKSDKLYSIGEVAKLKGTTVKTLRFYDKIGLVKPAYVDESTNYRYYKLEQLLLIEHVLMFKKNGASLAQIAAACKDDNSVVLADFFFSQILQAQDKITESKEAIDKYQQIATRIYHDKARSVNQDIYYRSMGERTVTSRECTTNPTHDNTYDIYFNVYNYIREKRLSTIYATGSIVDLNLDTKEISYKKMYVEVKNTESSLNIPLAQLPAGEYICVNYFAANQKQQLSKLIAEIKRQNIVPQLIIEADTYLNVTKYVNPMMELQVLF